MPFIYICGLFLFFFYGKVLRINPVFETRERFSIGKSGFDTFSSSAWFSSQMFGIQRTAWQKRKTKQWKVWLFRSGSISNRALRHCLTHRFIPNKNFPVSLNSRICQNRIQSKIRIHLSGLEVRNPTFLQAFTSASTSSFRIRILYVLVFVFVSEFSVQNDKRKEIYVGYIEDAGYHCV